MWAKIHKNRDHGRQSSGPGGDDGSAGQPVLQTTSGNPLPPKNVLKNLPALPSEATDSSNATRVTSSIYSRDDSGVRFADGSVLPSSPMRDYAEYSKYAADQEPDISPPDSPVDLPSGKRYSDVSPLESDNNFFDDVPKVNSSHLPVPKNRRGSTRGNDTAISPTKPLSNQRPADVSDGSGTSASITPQASRSESPLVAGVDSKSKETSKLLSAGKERFQMLSKMRDQKQREPKARQPWKGASGRSALVPPVDTKSFTKQNKKPLHHGAQRITDHGPLGHKADAYTITTISAGNPAPEKPGKTGQFRLRSRTASPAARDAPKEQKPVVYENTEPVVSVTTANPPTNQQSAQPAEVTAPASALEKSPQEPNISAMFHNLNVAHEPRSRFSASTYAPTEAAPSPPGSSHSDAPPMPPIDFDPSPIMTRRRPIPTSAGSIKSMKRKPLSSGDTPAPGEGDAEMKSLSPEEQAQRRVDSLEGRRKQLSLRKDSIRTMLHELTEVIQPSSIAYDMATRDEVKKTVASLKTELDDIGKEDHEIGLKLVRLYKNLNNASEFEHSTLWVKRITS